MNEYVEMLKHYVDFNGRTNVRGFWMAILIHTVITVLLSVAGQILQSAAVLYLSQIYYYATLIPYMAICVRRLKDGGKHWANIFWAILPVVGTIILIVKLCAPSVDSVQNQNGYQVYRGPEF